MLSLSDLIGVISLCATFYTLGYMSAERKGKKNRQQSGKLGGDFFY